MKYADDQGMVTNTEAGLQSLMESLSAAARHCDVRISIKKTKAMVVSRNGGWGRESEHKSRRSMR